MNGFIRLRVSGVNVMEMRKGAEGSVSAAIAKVGHRKRPDQRGFSLHPNSDLSLPIDFVCDGGTFALATCNRGLYGV